MAVALPNSVGIELDKEPQHRSRSLDNWSSKPSSVGTDPVKPGWESGVVKGGEHSARRTVVSASASATRRRTILWGNSRTVILQKQSTCEVRKLS